MNVLVIQNIAGRIDRLDAVLHHTASRHIDAIFVLGNLETPAQPAPISYRDVLERLGSIGVPVYLVPGAYDAAIADLRDAIDTCTEPGRIRLIHRTAAPLGATDVVAGFGGALTNGKTESDAPLHFPVWEARIAFEYLTSHDACFQTARRRILLFATPPRGARIDVEQGAHVGVPALNTLIRTYQPVLVCCGGPANARGVELIGGTRVVNPGSLAEGSYAWIDLDQDVVRLERLPEPIALDTMFHSIVVALDGSPEAWRALELAAGLARKTGARLTLVYAWEPVQSSLGQPYVDELVAERIGAGEQLLEQAAGYLSGLVAIREVLQGPPASAILRAAEAYHADLIVMGARGLGGVRAMLGSVSRKVLQHAPCPVLIARDQPRTAALAEQVAAPEYTGRG